MAGIGEVVFVVMVCLVFVVYLACLLEKPGRTE
jgi:uncharacterized membrane protein YtjA (UPF0391 family)